MVSVCLCCSKLTLDMDVEDGVHAIVTADQKSD